MEVYYDGLVERTNMYKKKRSIPFLFVPFSNVQYSICRFIDKQTCHFIFFTILSTTLVYFRHGNASVITLDVHFQQASMVKYRTDIVFDWLDLIGKINYTSYSGTIYGNVYWNKNTMYN